MVAGNPMIELKRLHRFFGRTRAVNDITFEVYPGQVFGYIGPNGAGKTTSMRILATLDMPSYGDAFVDGFSVIDDPDRVRRRLGFMPDYFGIYPNVNVREYLDFFARAYGILGRERLRAIDYVMKFTQLDELATKPITGLSKGMKQRLCLGRTMIHDPGVMILDEPAAGLDPRARIQLREMIRRLAAEGKTILISSHILSELAELCDAVTIIDRGKIKYTGSMHDLLARTGEHPTYRVTFDSLHPELAAKLEQLPGVLRVEPMEGRPEFRVTFDDAATTTNALLKQLLDWELPVLGFTPDRRHLNEAFMDLTERGVK